MPGAKKNKWEEDVVANLELEDEFVDVVSKAKMGLGLSAEKLAEFISELDKKSESKSEVDDFFRGVANETTIRKLAPFLKLNAEKLIRLKNVRKCPEIYPVVKVPDWLQIFTSSYFSMRVNSFLVYEQNRDSAKIDSDNCNDGKSKLSGILFDTGTEPEKILNFVRKKNIEIHGIFITHSHPDHIACITQLKEQLNIKQVFSPESEFIQGTTSISTGEKLTIAGFEVEVRATPGHSVGGLTYIVRKVCAENKTREREIAIVGDAIFSLSIGKPNISLSQALESIKQNIFSLPDGAILCPGHGPSTTVAHEKNHNSFF